MCVCVSVCDENDSSSGSWLREWKKMCLLNKTDIQFFNYYHCDGEFDLGENGWWFYFYLIFPLHLHDFTMFLVSTTMITHTHTHVMDAYTKICSSRVTMSICTRFILVPFGAMAHKMRIQKALSQLLHLSFKLRGHITSTPVLMTQGRISTESSTQILDSLTTQNLNSSKSTQTQESGARGCSTSGWALVGASSVPGPPQVPRAPLPELLSHHLQKPPALLKKVSVQNEAKCLHMHSKHLYKWD